MEPSGPDEVPRQMQLVPDAQGDLQPVVPGPTAREEILALRALGMGWTDIANDLNRRGVPTPTGRGAWWPESAQRHADPAAAAKWRETIADYRANVRRNQRGPE